VIRFVQLSSVFVGIILVIGLAGCTESSGLNTVPVKGSLTIDGEPANNVSITFTPLDASLATASGQVSNGSFELFSGTEGKAGAVPGKYKVVLAQVGGVDAEAAAAAYQGGGEGAGSSQSPGPGQQELSFPAKYLDASTSDKEVEVTSGSNDIKIEISGE